MSGPVLGMCGIAAMLAALLLLRIPAGFVMALVGFLGIATLTSLKAAMGLIGTEFWGVFSDYGLTVIPMFILLGQFVHHAGYSDRLYDAAYVWFGHRRGGLAISTIMASAGFSAICGSNTATAATMSAVAIPSMRKYKYDGTLAAGAVAAGSTLGVVIPPSIALVLYGLYTAQSIGKLFLGALIPGAILTLLMAGTVVAVCRRHPDWGPKGPKAAWSKKSKSVSAVLEILVLFAAIMFAFLTGVVTPTEAAAASCFLGLVICVSRRRLPWKKFVAAVYDTLRITSMVFMIVAGATVFGRFMTLTRLPLGLAALIGDLDWPNEMVLVLIFGAYLLGGCIMDGLAFLLLSLPIFFPLVEEMGYDPVWFGQAIVIVTTLGAITPPIGICCYVVAGISKDTPIENVFRGSLYYVPAYVITVTLLVLFPHWTVLVLANLVR